jgi:choline dehydrogenase-like flavoprotein
LYDAAARFSTGLGDHHTHDAQLAILVCGYNRALWTGYYSDPHDMEVMVAVLRRALNVVANWPKHRQIGPLFVPPTLAARHGHAPGDTPSDDLLSDLARHYSLTVYHLTSTCRIGSVVDPRLRVMGIAGLRVADASVMPNVISGNTNTAAIMIGEKAAEMLAADHGLQLTEFVAQPA